MSQPINKFYDWTTRLLYLHNMFRNNNHKLVLMSSSDLYSDGYIQIDFTYDKKIIINIIKIYLVKYREDIEPNVWTNILITK